MNIIKLSAIDSTNSFLKDLLMHQYIENFTVVVAENQNKGKGQVGANWDSERGKNLTFSVLIKDSLVDSSAVFILNTIISISVIRALEKYEIKKLAIKWPNDILSENKKIAGILIENIFKGNNEIVSVVGIGLNVNQLVFNNLPQASSLAILNKKIFNKEVLLDEILSQIKFHVTQLSRGIKLDFWEEYHALLFKKDIPCVFENVSKQQFLGIIKGVTKFGKLNVMLEDDSTKEFEIKELKMLY
jgi:BirA family transcriptional regulator, biotin operon repressor / biotin---[acetyl-CoA-carboxylase] ligase